MEVFIVIFSIVVFLATLIYIMWDAFKSNYICDECFHRMYTEKIIDNMYEEIRVLRCPKCGFKREIIITKYDD